MSDPKNIDKNNKMGLLIVDHGSRVDSANKSFENFIHSINEQTNKKTILPAHMELANPSIPQQLLKLYSLGFHKVEIIPFFLNSGRHVQKDIPQIVSQTLKEKKLAMEISYQPAFLQQERFQEFFIHLISSNQD